MDSPISDNPLLGFDHANHLLHPSPEAQQSRQTGGRYLAESIGVSKAARDLGIGDSTFLGILER
jgi:hypothetical protein